MKLNINSPLFEFLTTLAEFILLNVVFLITCLPIFTIGASLTALYTVTLQEARTEHGYILRTYFKSFKQNFLQGTALFFFFFLIGSILIFNLTFWYQLDIIIAPAIFILMIIATTISVIVFLYAFPLSARFQNSTKQTLKNALHMAMQNIKYTIFLLIMDGIFVFLCMVIPPAKVFMLILGFSFIAFCNSYLLIRVFKKYEPEDNPEAETDTLTKEESLEETTKKSI